MSSEEKIYIFLNWECFPKRVSDGEINKRKRKAAVERGTTILCTI